MSICQDCGGEYEAKGIHISKTDCSHPNYTDFQKDVMTGLLMGDGNIDYQSASNPRFRLFMNSRNFLEYLVDDVLNEHITPRNVFRERTAKEMSKRNRESGFCTSPPEKYKDLFGLTTYTNSELEEFAEWYSSGNKVFPEQEMNSTIMKYWFVCDGSTRFKSGSRYISFGVSNERGEEEKINTYFSKIDVEPRWFYNERTKGGVNTTISFNKNSSEKIFEYMGEPLPGYEYKWGEQ